MTGWELVAIAVAGWGAGFVNSVAGSGSLLTFPTLIAFGVPPVTANVSNNVGLVPGAVSGVIGWRHELVGQRPRLVRLASAAVVGGLVGAIALLVLPAAAFQAVVPVLVSLGVLLVAFQPVITRRVVRAHDQAVGHGDARWLWPGVGAVSVYGGYFGAAQGILLMAVLGSGTDATLHQDNAIKNALAGVVNFVAALVFIAVAEIDWLIAVVIAVGSVIGAQVGARMGRRMPAGLLRAAIVVIGLTALAAYVAQ